ncbi:MAG: hypothetical protein K6E75_06630 [Lachnospiraceae bacterium]|nr:hypothetical protein [Lachnospiraceae bacterium]
MGDETKKVLDLEDVKRLETGKPITVPSQHLANRVCYCYDDENTIIFPPPSEGEDVVLLQHIVNERMMRHNNLFGGEDEYERIYMVYHVESPIIKQGEKSPDNFARLSYKIGENRHIREIPYREFYCGLYCAMPLTDEGLKRMERNRGIIDNLREIRRGARILGNYRQAHEGELLFEEEFSDYEENDE